MIYHNDSSSSANSYSPPPYEEACTDTDTDTIDERSQNAFTDGGENRKRERCDDKPSECPSSSPEPSRDEKESHYLSRL